MMKMVLIIDTYSGYRRLSKKRADTQVRPYQYGATYVSPHPWRFITAFGFFWDSLMMAEQSR